jgi:methyl-accepting chemotaxis protein
LSEDTEALMEDKRRLKRTRIRQNACIVVSDHVPIMHCTVRDVTNEGARLSVASSSELPTVFQLSFDSCRSMRQCRMVWAGQREVGVVFFTDA